MKTEAPTESIVVPRRRLDPASVPQLCLKTGEAAQCLVPTVAVSMPSWAWILVVPGGAPYFAARRWLFPRELLSLPARNRVYEQWQLVRRATAGCFAVAIVIALWSVVTLNPLGILTAAFAGALTTGVWTLLTPKVWIAAELDGERIRLHGVHYSAARALERG
jgi:hypothetical protein